MWIQVCIGHIGVYRGHYGDVKGRLFVSYKPYLVLLKYMIGKIYIIAVSEVGQPLMVLDRRCHSCQRGVMAISKALT